MRRDDDNDGILILWKLSPLNYDNLFLKNYLRQYGPYDKHNISIKCRLGKQIIIDEATWM